MKDVTVSRDRLVEKIQVNRDAHRAEFEKAIVAYKARIITELEERLDDARHGRNVEHYIRLPIPEDHTDDYDQVLEMLAMEIRPEITIDYNTFRRYVMDDWDWKQTTTATNTFYAASAK